MNVSVELILEYPYHSESCNVSCHCKETWAGVVPQFEILRNETRLI